MLAVQRACDKYKAAHDALEELGGSATMAPAQRQLVVWYRQMVEAVREEQEQVGEIQTGFQVYR